MHEVEPPGPKPRSGTNSLEARARTGSGSVKVLLVALVTSALLLSTTRAHAYHTSEEFLIDDTAYTLRQNEFRLGLFHFDYGIFDWWQVGTYIAPWILRAPNFNMKFQVWSNEDWSIALRAGLMWLNAQNVDDETTEATFWVIPFDLWVGFWIVDEFNLTLSSTFTKIALQGTFNDDDFEGVAAVTNLQFALTAEWRITDVTALLLYFRYVAYQWTSAAGSIVLQPDEYTSVEIIGAASTDVVDVQHAFSISVAVALSWETFSLRVGAGWGNYTIPALNFVLPSPIPFPELDLYWRF